MRFPELSCVGVIQSVQVVPTDSEFQKVWLTTTMSGPEQVTVISIDTVVGSLQQQLDGEAHLDHG